jgi:lysozyme
MTALERQLTDHEDRRLKPYTDTTGHLSIGVGRNLSDVGIFEDEADLMLENDIARTMGALLLRVPWAEQLDVIRQRVLIDLAFNMGTDGLLKFHRMLSATRTGDYDTAAAEMIASRWAGQVGRRATRLSRMMRTGRDE